MSSKKPIRLLRTDFPYLTDGEKEFYKNYQRELKENNVTEEEGVLEIFKRIGTDIDLDAL